MNSAPNRTIRCSVEGAEQLPQELGGEGDICSTMEAAALPALRDAGIAASTVVILVKVKSPYRISAIAESNGTSLGEQKVGISDRPLNKSAIEMLARAVAGQLSKLRH